MIIGNCAQFLEKHHVRCSAANIGKLELHKFDTDIDTTIFIEYGGSLPKSFAPEDWIATSQAEPHTDDVFAHNYFVTINFSPDYQYFVGCNENNGCVLKYGDVFIVDPRKMHWLFLNRNERMAGTLGYNSRTVTASTAKKRWLGLQWLTPRTKKAVQCVLNSVEMVYYTPTKQNSAVHKFIPKTVVDFVDHYC